MKVNGKRRLAVVLTGVLATLGLLATSSSAVPLYKSAVQPIGIAMVAQDDLWSTNSSSWVELPDSRIQIVAHNDSFLRGSFSAESACLSERDGFCSARIVVRADTGVEVFDPVTEDFAFDSPEQQEPYREKPESHAVERSSRELKAGVYEVWVEVRVDGPVFRFDLDDWHFTIEAMCTNGPICPS